jgi:hypothetical protein
MARVMPETVQNLARQLYEYELTDEAAPTVARMVGAMAAYSRRLNALGLGGLQAPLGYPTLIAEAGRLRRR